MTELLAKKFLIVTDMDGTLLNSDNKISEVNKKSIRDFVDKGGLFTIATGRMISSVKPYLKDLPLNIPVILYNGGLIYDFKTNQKLWEKTLDKKAETVIKKLYRLFPDMGIEIYHNDKVYIIQKNKEIEKHIEKEQFLSVPAKLEDITQPWQKILLAWNPESLDLVESVLKNYIAVVDYIRSEPQFLELVAKGVNKGNALEYLLKLLGIEKQFVLSVGDNLNDLEMLRCSGVGVAVKNAHSKLKETAKFYCGHHNHNAVSEIIENLDKFIC